ncbi:MAG: TonB family protein [Tahibacter sp.]
MSTATLDPRETFQWSRSSAIGVVLALHAFAALMLLAPPAMETIQRQERAADPIFVMPEPKPPVVIPVEPLKPIVHVKTPPPITVPKIPTPVERPIVDEVSEVSEPANPEPPAPERGQTSQPVADTAPSALGYRTMSAVPYPIASVKRKEQGRVMLRVLVGVDGIPQKVEIESSSGFVALDRAARDAVAKWRFTPGTRNGEAFAAWGLVPVEFTLNEL